MSYHLHWLPIHNITQKTLCGLIPLTVPWHLQWPGHIELLAVPKPTPVSYWALHGFPLAQSNLPLFTPNSNLAFHSLLGCYFFWEAVSAQRLGQITFQYTARTMPTQYSWTRDKANQKVMDRGQELQQMKSFLKPFSPQLIPHPEGTREVFLHKLAPTFHHAPASPCCAMLYGRPAEPWVP